MIDDETRRRIEADLAAIMPFTQIAARHGVGFVDVALIHHRMRPQPVAWPEAIPSELANAARAALRRADHRETWLAMTFDPLPADIDRAVVELWSNAGTSTKVACEILDVDLAGLVRLAGEFGLPLRPGVSMTVAPAGLPNSVFERLQRIADEDPESDA